MSGIKNSFELIGIIGKPHGIKGYVYVSVFTGYPDNIVKDSILYIDENCSSELVVEETANHTGKNGPRTVIKFHGISSRNAAENLRGKSLYKIFSGRPVLKDDTYWVEDLIGCAVHTINGVLVGHVKEVENYISNDILIVEPVNITADDKDYKKKLIIIPMVDQYLKEVNITGKIIILSTVPEYI